MADIDQCRGLLQQVEKKLAARLQKKHGLICRELPYGSDSAVIYVAKEHWTNRFDPQCKLTIGVFFSAWVTPEFLERGVFSYNIHSLKLRRLPGYRLTSVKFASDFRVRVANQVADWPNLSIDYGPLTLLEGHDEFHADDFCQRVTERIDAFAEIHTHLDELLDAARV